MDGILNFGKAATYPAEWSGRDSRYWPTRAATALRRRTDQTRRRRLGWGRRPRGPRGL